MTPQDWHLLVICAVVLTVAFVALIAASVVGFVWILGKAKKETEAFENSRKEMKKKFPHLGPFQL